MHVFDVYELCARALFCMELGFSFIFDKLLQCNINKLEVGSHDGK